MWFTIQDEIVISYSNIKANSTLLPNNIYEIEKHVENPDIYLGQHVDALSIENFVPKVSKEEILQKFRNKLKKLYNEIQFRKDIGDDTTKLEQDYEQVKIEYNNAKASE